MTTREGSGGRSGGSQRAAGSATCAPRVECRVDAGIEDLWSALPDPVRLARWHGRARGDLRPGGTFRLSLDSEGWDGTGRVEACEPPLRFRVATRESDESWRAGHGAPPFDEHIDVELRAEGDQTDLVVEVSGIPRDLLVFYGAGWQAHAERLAAFLAGREEEATRARWDELVASYRAMEAGLGQVDGPHDDRPGPFLA